LAFTCPNCGVEQPPTANFCAGCGQALAGMNLLGGTVLDRRYQVVTVLSSGPVGAVYRAADLRLGRHHLAVKEFRTEHLDGPQRERAYHAFEQEVRHWTSLRHPGIPVIHDLFEFAGNFYLVMDLVEGDDLGEVLRRQGRERGRGLNSTRVAAWGRQLCGILDYLHSQDPPLVFGSLLPAHVMYRSRDGALILVDLNLNRLFLPAGSTAGPLTRRYQAPEQAEGAATPASDLYSLGAVLLHLVTGKTPTATWNRRRIEELSPGWQAFFTRALQSDPGDRFSSAREMERALRVLEAGLPPTQDDIPSIPDGSPAPLSSGLGSTAADTWGQAPAGGRTTSAEGRMTSAGGRMTPAGGRTTSAGGRATPAGRRAPGAAARLAAEALENLKQHRVSEAILRCNQALIMDPDCMEAYLYLGHAYLKDDRPSLAVENYRKALTLAPHDSRVHCNLALGLTRVGAWADAESALVRALELDPDNLVARNNLGSLYRELGRRDEALTAYRAVVDRDPDYMAAHYNLGLTYYEMGRFKEAVKECKAALKLDPGNLQACINLGLVYYQMGKFKQCVEIHHQALEIDSNNAVIYNNLGVALSALGRRDEALAAFQRAILLDSQMALSRHNLQILAQEGSD